MKLGHPPVVASYHCIHYIPSFTDLYSAIPVDWRAFASVSLYKMYQITHRMLDPFQKSLTSSQEKNKGNFLSMRGLLKQQWCCFLVLLSRPQELWITWAALWTKADLLSSSRPSAGWSSLPPPPPCDWRTLPACSSHCLVHSRGFKRTQRFTSLSKNFRATVEHNIQVYIPRQHVVPLSFHTQALPMGSSARTMAIGIWQDSPSFTSPVILNCPHQSLEPQFLHLRNEDNNTYFTGSFGKFREAVSTRAVSATQRALNKQQPSLPSPRPSSLRVSCHCHGHAEMQVSGGVVLFSQDGNTRCLLFW